MPRHPLAGMALVGLGAIGFGLMPLFARTAYAEGLAPASLLVWRFVFAVLCCLPMLPRMAAAPRPLAIAVLAGASYMGSMLFYFIALQHLSVALTVLILFTYPLFTILLGRLFFGQRLTAASLAAAILIIAAAVFILSPERLANADLLTIGAAFVPPLAYALFINVAARHLASLEIPVRLGGVFLGGLFTMIALAFAMEGGITVPATPLAWSVAAALGVFSTFGALGLLLVGAPIAGPERSAIAGASELVTSLAVGILAFGEILDWRTALGAVLILVALIVSARTE